jgi:hypothetical protein
VKEIERLRQKFIVYIGSFYMKTNHLKSNGQKFTTMKFIDEWLEINLDDLFQDQGLRHFFDVEVAVNTKEIERSIFSKSEDG